GFQCRGVVVFDLDAASAEFRYLGADVADLPRCLGLLPGGSRCCSWSRPGGCRRRTGTRWRSGLPFRSAARVCRGRTLWLRRGPWPAARGRSDGLQAWLLLLSVDDQLIPQGAGHVIPHLPAMEVVALIEVLDEPGMCRLPAQQLAGQRA